MKYILAILITFCFLHSASANPSELNKTKTKEAPSKKEVETIEFIFDDFDKGDNTPINVKCIKNSDGFIYCERVVSGN